MGDIEIILPMKFKQKWFIMNKNHFKRIKLRIIETGSLLFKKAVTIEFK